MSVNVCELKRLLATYVDKLHEIIRNFDHIQIDRMIVSFSIGTQLEQRCELDVGYLRNTSRIDQAADWEQKEADWWINRSSNNKGQVLM